MHFTNWFCVNLNFQSTTNTHTHNHLTTFVRDNPGRPVPEETLTHSHPTWSSDILYHLPPFTTIHGILFDHFTCLTILSDNLSSWSWTLNFIFHTFLYPIDIIFSQHMPIPTQPVLLQKKDNMGGWDWKHSLFFIQSTTKYKTKQTQKIKAKSGCLVLHLA